MNYQREIDSIMLRVTEVLKERNIPETLWPVIMSNATEQMRLRISHQVASEA